jgi:PAS domain S-box-containing protein
MKRSVWKIIILSFFILCSLVFSLYFRLVIRTDIVYTHFFYIPIVLSSSWYGRKGMLVGGGLGVVVLSFHFIGPGGSNIYNDAARVAAFLAVSFFIGTLREKVQAGQDALLASEEKYRLLIDKSIAGIFLYRNDRILFANSRFGEILGIDQGTLIGRFLWDIVHTDDHQRVTRYTERLTSLRRHSVRYECRLVGERGKIIWADVAGTMTDYEGTPAVMVHVYDITEAKEAEEKQRRLKEIARTQEEQLVHSTRLAELGEMAAGISHELNQPLTGIRNFARNALYMIEHSAGGEEEIKDNLRLVSEQVDRASKIINKMREFTRKSELHFTELDLNAIVRESVDFVMPQMKLAGVRVTLDLDPELPLIIGDKIRLEQVFLNLLTNAKQAMESSDEQQLDVRTFCDLGHECSVVVEIEDTGMGFEPQMADKLFAPFYTTKKTGHGTGLGLSISLSIIKDHNGSIEAAGSVGKGAVFTVRFPAPDRNNRGNSHGEKH